MAKSRQGEKRKILVDGEEIPGMIAMSEYIVEDDSIESPGQDKVIMLRNGVQKIPEIDVTFRRDRDTPTEKLLKDWYYQNETHEVTVIRTDSAGNEFGRELWPETECRKFHTPAYDASAPVPAQIIVALLPEDIILIGAE